MGTAAGRDDLKERQDARRVITPDPAAADAYLRRLGLRLQVVYQPADQGVPARDMRLPRGRPPDPARRDNGPATPR
jgi:hypothetical protein